MIHTIIAFFEIWSLGFWLLIAIASIVFTASVENDTFGWAITAALVLLGMYHSYVFAFSPWHLLVGFGIYVVAGGLWSIYRWFRHTRKQVERFNNKEIGLMDTLHRHIDPAQHKSQIAGWIAFWPWSLLWNITGDFFASLYDGLKGVYGAISTSALKNIKK